MSQSFTFDGYTVRPITEADRSYLAYLIEQDEYHQDKMTVDFFLKLEPGEEAYAIEDDRGGIVFYFKTSVAIRIDVQFAPINGLADTRRNLDGLMKGFRWVEGLFRAKRYREIIFEPQGPELYLMAKNRLGFVDASLVSRRLGSPINPPQGHGDTVGTVPTVMSEREG